MYVHFFKRFMFVHTSYFDILGDAPPYILYSCFLTLVVPMMSSPGAQITYIQSCSAQPAFCVTGLDSSTSGSTKWRWVQRQGRARGSVMGLVKWVWPELNSDEHMEWPRSVVEAPSIQVKDLCYFFTKWTRICVYLLTWHKWNCTRGFADPRSWVATHVADNANC